MAARHLPRVGGVVFQAVQDRGGADVSGAEVGGRGAAGPSARDASVVVGGGGDDGEAGKVAEAVGGGGAFSVENELTRMQGELSALLAYVFPCLIEHCVSVLF